MTQTAADMLLDILQDWGVMSYLVSPVMASMGSWKH